MRAAAHPPSPPQELKLTAAYNTIAKAELYKDYNRVGGTANNYIHRDAASVWLPPELSRIMQLKTGFKATGACVANGQVLDSDKSCFVSAMGATEKAGAVLGSRQGLSVQQAMLACMKRGTCPPRPSPFRPASLLSPHPQAHPSSLSPATCNPTGDFPGANSRTRQDIEPKLVGVRCTLT